MDFQQAYDAMWKELGRGSHMVLSTSLHDEVTSRMMSVVVLDGKMYFQTDRSMRKYKQLMGNPHAALCAENLQMEGNCAMLGHPLQHPAFAAAYRALYPGSFARYSAREGECLFVFTPVSIRRWVYKDDSPYVETFCVETRQYTLEAYI